MTKTATALRLVSAGPKRSFIELTDSGRAMPSAHSGVLRTEPSFTVSALRALAVIARGRAA
jgi:hypothetical protein